eukprot:7024755-Prymnesium_polylepis.2
MAESNHLVTAAGCASSIEQTTEEEYRDDDQDVLDENLDDGALPTIAPLEDWNVPRSERERLWKQERTLFPNLSGVPDESSDDTDTSETVAGDFANTLDATSNSFSTTSWYAMFGIMRCCQTSTATMDDDDTTLLLAGTDANYSDQESIWTILRQNCKPPKDPPPPSPPPPCASPSPPSPLIF